MDAGTVGAVAHPYWPVFDLRLSAGQLTLRPITEADLGRLADIKPPDVEQDPALPVPPGGDPRATRGAAVHQSYWQAMGAWRPDNWRLGFAVQVNGRIVGVQELEARDFATLATVDSSSWLITEVRGRGLGRAMRRAALALAFDGLDAEYAVTSAWHDNPASLGVSRSLGYADNGHDRHHRGTRGDEMVRMRMTRATWLARHADHGVRIDNLPECRAWFGRP